MSTHNIPIFNIRKENHPKLFKNYSAVMGFFSKGLKNEFETTMVNEPSAFEPLTFYCILCSQRPSGCGLVKCFYVDTVE